MRLTSACGPEIETLRSRSVKRVQEAHFVGQAERAGRQLRADDALVEVVVEALRPVIDLDAGQPLGEVVDHVVALQLAVGDDVDAGDLLILDRRLARRFVHVVEIVAADLALQVVVLGALEPGGHRVAADDGGGQEGQSHACLVARCRVEDLRLRTLAVAERREVHVVAGARADRAQEGAVDPRHERAIEFARAAEALRVVLDRSRRRCPAPAGSRAGAAAAAVLTKLSAAPRDRWKRMSCGASASRSSSGDAADALRQVVLVALVERCAAALRAGSRPRCAFQNTMPRSSSPIASGPYSSSRFIVVRQLRARRSRTRRAGAAPRRALM